MSAASQTIHGVLIIRTVPFREYNVKWECKFTPSDRGYDAFPTRLPAVTLTESPHEPFAEHA